MCRIKFICGYLISLLFNVCLVSGQFNSYPQSPCPDNFQYTNYDGTVYGTIRFKLSQPATTVHTITNFSIPALLVGNNVGSLDPIGKQLDLLKRLNQGQSITYRVRFPISNPLPQLTQLTVNGDVICYDPNSGVGGTMTRISLHHTLYLRSGTIPINYDYFNKQRPGQNRPDNFETRPEPDSFDTPSFSNDNNNNNNNFFTSNRDSWNGGVDDRRISVHHSQPYQSDTYTVYYHNFYKQRPNQNRPDYFGTRPDYYETRPDYFETRPYYPETRPEQDYFERPNYSSDSNNNNNIFTNNRHSWNEIMPFVSNSSRPVDPSTVYQIFDQTPSSPSRPATRPQETSQWQNQPQWTPPAAPIPQPTQESANFQCGIVQGGNERVPLVHHGQAYNRGDWPWAAAVYSKREGGLTFKCGGTLVSDRHVLSAAHCVLLKGQRTATRDIVVRVGVYDPEDWGDDIPITRTLTAIHIHESYNDKTLSNDISLFTLIKSVDFNYNIRAACLWEGDNDLGRIVGTTGVVTGWGQTENGPSGHGPPRMVRMPIRSTADCRASKADFHQLTSDTTLCAGDRNGAGPCNGDSGGGLFVLDNGRWRVRGIVSVSLRPDNGASTCNLNEYIVFTDASKYISWISGIIRS